MLSDGPLDIVLLDGEADRLPALVHRVEALAGTSSARIVCFVSSGDARRIGAPRGPAPRAASRRPWRPTASPPSCGRPAAARSSTHPHVTRSRHLQALACLSVRLTHRELEVLTLAAEGLRTSRSRSASG